VKVSRLGLFEPMEFLREIELLVKINHPCIVRIFGYSLPYRERSAEIVFEYAANGSLYDVLRKARTSAVPAFWNPTGISIIIIGIVLGMRYVHSIGIMHLDLKPSNILIDEHGRPMISDFGSGRWAGDDSTPELRGPGGSIQYAAPEMFEEGEYATKVDVVAFGLILYEIIAGRPVFAQGEPPFSVIRRWHEGITETIPDSVNPEIGELIPMCWKRDPDERPSFDDIFHTFEKIGFDVIPGARNTWVREFVATVLGKESMIAQSNAAGRAHRNYHPATGKSDEGY
jgi:serine/threonine protein kinase